MVLAGMFGGQRNKSVRRYGIPAIAVGMAVKWDGFQWRDTCFLMLIPLLINGYGENSFLMSVLHNEILVRGVYALMLSLPFLLLGILRWVCSAVLLMAAFQVQAGSIGKLDGMDLLIEDICRYSVLAGLILFNIIK